MSAVENTIAVLILHPEIHVQFILETPFLYNCPLRNSLYIFCSFDDSSNTSSLIVFFQRLIFFAVFVDWLLQQLGTVWDTITICCQNYQRENIKTVKKKCGTKTRVLNILWRTDITQVTKRHFLLWELLTPDNTLVALETTEKVIEETVTQKTWQ